VAADARRDASKSQPSIHLSSSPVLCSETHAPLTAAQWHCCAHAVGQDSLLANWLLCTRSQKRKERETMVIFAKLYIHSSNSQTRLLLISVSTTHASQPLPGPPVSLLLASCTALLAPPKASTLPNLRSYTCPGVPREGGHSLESSSAQPTPLWMRPLETPSHAVEERSSSMVPQCPGQRRRASGNRSAGVRSSMGAPKS
jgi:hypothetical protein